MCNVILRETVTDTPKRTSAFNRYIAQSLIVQLILYIHDYFIPFLKMKNLRPPDMLTRPEHAPSPTQEAPSVLPPGWEAKRPQTESTKNRQRPPTPKTTWPGWLRIYIDSIAMFKAFITTGKKQFFSLFAFALEYLRLWPRWVKSLMMFLAFLRQRGQWSSSKEGRVITVIFLCCLYDPLECFPLCHCAAGEPHTDTVGQDSLFWAGHQQFLGDVFLP